MPGEDGRKKLMGPLPTLFVGVGPCAQETLTELSRMTAGLTAPIQGPCGLALADSYGEGLFTCHWLWASDFRVPEPALVREGSEFVGREDEKLAASLSALVRRLHSVEPGADLAPGGRMRLSVYVAIDLSETAAVASALRLMRVIRQVDVGADTTVLGLTARTAACGCARDNQWFETWKGLLEQLQDGSFAQRVYLLDGCDADKIWFERPEQLHRLGAEFLLYHGLTCRGLLRQGERARTGSHESLLNVCGSFGCRTLEADLAVVAERIAGRLAREDLAPLYKRTVPAGWFDSIQEQARSLVERIATICERAYQARASSAGARGDRPGTCWSENAEITEAIRRTVKYVCSREPVVSLCLFFQVLRPRMARLLSRQKFWERARTRHLVAQAFRRQEESTYEPMRVWLSRPGTQWVDRFTPAQQEAPEVAVSRPAGMKSFLAGWLVLAVGLVGVVAAFSWPSRLLAAGSGLVSIAASVFMIAPLGWTRHPRSRLREGQDVRAFVAPVLYRKGPNWRIRLACAAAVLAGLAGVVWPLWPDAWTFTTRIRAIVLAALAAIGLASVVTCPSETCPDEVSKKEASDHVNPPVRWCLTLGLSCLALAWVVLWLGTPMPLTTATTAQWLVRLVGLALVAGGLGWALFPRTGAVYLVDRVARMPQPLTGGIAYPVKERELPRGVLAMAAWVSRLTVEPDVCLKRFEAADAGPAREGAANAKGAVWVGDTLLDFLATDWEGQLAQAFRRAVEARSGKSLKVLALQPVLWAECVVHELQNPQEGSGELTSLFALQAVKAWIESHTLAELLSFLSIDLARFGSLVGRLASAHWPSPRVEPDMNASVIAVGRPLWDAVAPLAKTPGAPAVVLLDWDAREDRIVVLRAVQGLTQGWRGLPGMPGLLHESGRTAPVQA